MNSSEIIRYYVSGRWREKPLAMRYFDSVGSLLQVNISDFYKSCTLNIDDAALDQLDLIGAIIDGKRPLLPSNLEFFGYRTTPGATAYNVAPYFDKDSLDVEPLTDTYYKFLLKAKVIFNTTDCTRVSILRATRTLLQVEDVEVVDDGKLEFAIKIYDPVDDVILSLLQLNGAVIKPASVKFLGFLKG